MWPYHTILRSRYNTSREKKDSYKVVRIAGLLACLVHLSDRSGRRSENTGGVIINSRSLEGKYFVFNSNKIWGVGSKCPPLCPLASTGPAIISMRYHEQMRWTMNDERAEPWSKRNEKWIHNFGVQKIDGRTRESRKSHSWLASKVVVYKYCGELFLLEYIWVGTVVVSKN